MGYDTESRPLGVFCREIASDRVLPAGGTAGAVVGTIGTALCEMVCLHLDQADVSTAVDLVDRRTTLETRRATLFTLADEDAAIVDELFGADGDLDPDPTLVKRAVGVPLTVAETCQTVLELATEVTGASDRPVIADAGTGAFLVHAALQNAVFTVRRNLDSVDDQSFTEETERRATALKTAGDRAFEAVLANVDTDE